MEIKRNNAMIQVRSESLIKFLFILISRTREQE